MDKVVIRVRYRDLPPGLNGDAAREGGKVVVYFAPGLSAQQRKAALRRLRQAASRGQKPPLPTVPLALALAADRLRAKASTAFAIVRLHPAGTVVPAFGLAALIGMFFLTSVSVHILHGPPTVNQGTVIGGGPPVIPGNTVQPAAQGHRVVPSGSQAEWNGAQTQVTSSPTPVPTPASTGSSSGSPPGVPGGTPGGGSGGGPGTTPDPGSVISAQVDVGSAIRASVAVTPRAPASPQPAPSGVCVHLGPLGICLSM